MRRALPLVALLLATSCSLGADGNMGRTQHDPIHVDAMGCAVRPGSFESGRRTFRITSNTGEFATVRFHSAGSELASPSLLRDLVTTFYVPPGELTIDCPNDVRTTVSVPLVNSAEPAGRAVAVRAREFRFENLETFTARTGETVRFDVRNDGGMGHVFQVRDPGGRVVAETPRLPGARTAGATATFREVGTYTYVCELDHHDGRGMKGTFRVE